MFEKGRRFDALDIVFFVVGVLAGAVVTSLAVGIAYVPAGVLVFGATGLALRQVVFPQSRSELYAKRAETTTWRSVARAICLALGMVLAPVTGLVTVATLIREVILRDGKGLGFLALATLAFLVSVTMLRFAFDAGRR